MCCHPMDFIKLMYASKAPYGFKKPFGLSFVFNEIVMSSSRGLAFSESYIYDKWTIYSQNDSKKQIGELQPKANTSRIQSTIPSKKSILTTKTKLQN